MPRFKSIIFYLTRPKIMLFLQKNAKFSSAGVQTPNSLQQLGAPSPDPQNSLPPLRISGPAWQVCTVYNYTRFWSFCFEHFFLGRSDANPMMLTMDVCLMLKCFCLKSSFCITHCATLIPSCDIAISYLFAKV